MFCITVYYNTMSNLSFYILSTHVYIFSKTTCGYCTKAKQLLQHYGVEYELVELDKINQGTTIANEIKNMTGQSTVPNIFIYGEHIGGYSELFKLHKNGELRLMLQNNVKPQLKYICDTCGKGSNNFQLDCNCFQRSFCDWGSPL